MEEKNGEKYSVIWFLNQIDHLSRLWKENKLKFFLVIVCYLVILGSVLLYVIYIPHLKGKITELDKTNTNLEIRLAPFRAVALEKFSGTSENEALSALAERIGQVELQVISLFDYQEVSTWTFLGNSVKKLGNEVTANGNSPAQDWSKSYIRLSDKGQIESIDCSTQAIHQYLGTIQRFELFPFPYYVLAKCEQKSNDSEWQVNFGKAYKILSITTKIHGHHLDHDAVLNQMTHE